MTFMEFGMWYAVVSVVLFVVGSFMDYLWDCWLGYYMEQIGFAMMALVGVVFCVLLALACVVALVGAVL